MSTTDCPNCGRQLQPLPGGGRPGCPVCEAATLPPALGANGAPPAASSQGTVTLPPTVAPNPEGDPGAAGGHASCEAALPDVASAPPGYALEGELGRGG